MDTDHLFVSFRHEALEPVRGEPVFHEEIGEFALGLNEDRFEEFYEGRFRWHRYPIITSGFSSFPVHGDLCSVLGQARLLDAIGYAAAICAREEGNRFVSALGLLSLLCRNCGKPTAVPSLTRHYMVIRDRAGGHAEDPNIGYWFSKVALFQFRTGVVPDGYTGEFDRSGLNAPDSGA